MKTELILDGFYYYFDNIETKGKLEGKISLDSKGFFKGHILNDLSKNRKHKIIGQIKSQGNIIYLSFIKFSLNFNLADLIYELEKSSSEEFTGKYIGRWSALPYKFMIDETTGLILKRIDYKVLRGWGLTEIKLY